ncbi:MAG: isoleucine--tRNA ligase, partial [bacterium]|nr:isoleucine--tRNA ligase [bacterium]
FKTMQGYTCLRKGGWDTHGLPVELTSEKELGLKGKVDIEKFGIEKFIEHCRSTVLRFRSDWIAAILRIGRFVDLENDYLTMSNDFIQSDWWVIKKAFEQNLLYKDYKIVPYCCRCGTGLSSHEVAQGYQDITDLTLTAKFALINEQNTYILAWTTTPWTLLGNTALCVNEEIEYSKIRLQNKDGQDEFIILASARIDSYKKALGDNFTEVEKFPGKDLIGKKYQPLWPTNRSDKGKAFEIVADDFVTTEDGTGVVHLALYGEDDFRLIKKHSFVQIKHVGPDGKFDSDCGAYSGRFFKEDGLEVDIVKDLNAKGLLFDKYRYEHSYPHCWRCKTPLMYFAKSSWFLKTTAFKDLMISENNKINWQPAHIKEGRFGNWLENNVDWAISRDRYWGSPINIWTSVKDASKKICVSSIQELQDLGAFYETTGQKILADLDLHLPIIDDVIIKDKNGDVYKRESGVLDCWFNAGVMPWGQFGFPAKEGSKELFQNQFPADFICEAIDQTRGWFYTLLAVSCLVSKKSSFKNVICTELILDAEGKKMSKSLGNVINPIPLIEKFGADAVRWTFYNSNPWQVKRYSEDLPKEALRSTFIPLWNCYSFFVTYARLDGWTPKNGEKMQLSELDRWILSALRSLIVEVEQALENYDIFRASNAISQFIDSLSNWYIRRSRRRFWKSGNDENKQAAYSTLYRVLVTISKVMAPLSPFISETIYSNLVSKFDTSAPESVHLASWPSSSEFQLELDLEEEISVIQEAATLARSLREEHDLKVRQPLSNLLITPSKPELTQRLERHLESLSEEVNVKKITFLKTSSEFVDISIKPNWKVLGPRFGEKIKVVAQLVQGLDAQAVSKLASGQNVNILLDGLEVAINPTEVSVEQRARAGMVAKSGRSVTVALHTILTPELISEGTARELVSIIQRFRKKNNLEINDNIAVKIKVSDALKEAINSHIDYISKECLIGSVEFLSNLEGETFDLNGQALTVELNKE